MSAAKKPAAAQVLQNGVVAGRIERTPLGAIFEYEPAFLAARSGVPRGIAYRLPETPSRVETLGTNLHPFFAGLLPEGLRLTALVRRVKTSEDDLLSLLIAAGADCIGDVSVVSSLEAPREVTPAVDLSTPGSLRFADVLAASLSGNARLEPTLPGVQEKVSAAMISLPLRGARGAGSYILKLNPPRMPRLVENELFFLQMARAIGLDVTKAKLLHDAEGASGLLVERFDRIREKAGSTRAVHQEDACQFLDRYPADKYLLSYGDIAIAIGELASAPVVELAKYLRLIAFSYLVANGDLHAKNVSLRTVADRGLTELTPAYDVLSSLPYGDRTMALTLDGRDDNLRRKGFVAFGERHGVRAAATLSMLDELCDEAPSWIARLEEIGLEEKRTADLARVMKKRRADLGAAR